MRERHALFVDLYELTMLQGYWREGMHDRAVFSLYYRSLPGEWNYAVACGLDTVLSYLETLRFDDTDLEWLAQDRGFQDEFLRWLEELRFTGDVTALPEGTPVFPDEPILEVHAPLPEAQLIETFVMNQIHLQTVLATSATRVVEAAGSRAVVDFGMRRMHGIDAALKGARAFHIAGVSATSNVMAGRAYGLPVTGTMAHSYIQAHETEEEAFRTFADLYPDTVLLVDTYDTLAGVDRVVALARELGDAFAVRAIRLDSGDLDELAREARRRLDAAGLQGVEILASGGLDEFSIRDLVRTDAPINGFGVGTRMGVSVGAPVLDIAYKLTQYADEGRLKLSPGKRILPGPKQVFRQEEGSLDIGDILGRASETLPGRPLLEPVMRAGERLEAGRRPLGEIRSHAAEARGRIAAAMRTPEKAPEPWPVRVSEALSGALERTELRIESGQD